MDDTASEAPEHLRPERSSRGFTRLPPIQGLHGEPPIPLGQLQVYESSSASGPYVWVRAQEPADIDRLDGPTKAATVHVPLDRAVEFAEQIMWFARNHYQVR